MKPKSNAVARAAEKDIARAGKLLFGALFGGDSIGDGLARAVEAEERQEEIAAMSYATLRCAACGREVVLPSTMPSSALEQLGWRTVRAQDGSVAWRCGGCGNGAR
jgi:hypothetical protein